MKTTLDLLSVAVAHHYKELGDQTVAGVTIAYLGYAPGETRGFYASVLRYPSGPERKVLICRTVPDANYADPEGAIKALAEIWLHITERPSSLTARKELGDRLNGRS